MMHNFHYLKTENKKKHLYCQATVIAVHGNCSDPAPVKAHGQSCHRLSLVNIAGDRSEEVGKLSSVTQTGAASHEADLRRKYNRDKEEWLSLSFLLCPKMSSEVKLTTGTEKGISVLDRRMLVSDAAPPMSSGTDL